MYISDIFKKKKAVYSFEIFPPKPTADLDGIKRTISDLADLKPDYISVTCSAGGSGNSRTIEIASMLLNEYGIEPLAHLTCINSGASEVANGIERLKMAKIDNVLALRGDLIPTSTLSPDFKHASDLIEFINKSGHKFDIAAACYPETHPEAISPEDDIKQLARKVEAGATHLNTQLFFDNELFYRFMDRLRKAGVTVPVQAGIMPLVKKNHIDRIISLSGAEIPSKISRMVSKFYDDPESLQQAGIAYATDQIADLLSAGVDGIHLYVMNNSEVARKITENVSGMLGYVNK